MIKEDKIFNNTFGDNVEDTGPISFVVDPAFDEECDHFEDFHYAQFYDEFDLVISTSKFNHLNHTSEQGVTHKMTKVNANELFMFSCDTFDKKYTKTDIFGVITEYFMLDATKYYNMLSNKFKDELIKEIDKKYNILEKKNIFKLF